MSEHQAFQELVKQIKKAHRRYCAILFANLWVRSLFYLSVVAAVVIIAFALTPFVIPRLWVPIAAAGASVPFALLWFMRQARSLNTTAVIADEHLQLKEKISSALEFGQSIRNGEPLSPWQSAVLRDALHETRRLHLQRAFPWKGPQEGRYLWVPVFMMMLAVYLMPQWNLFAQQPEAAESETVAQETIKKELQALEKKANILSERRKLDEKREESAQLAREVKELAAQFSKGQIEKREALAELSTMEQKWEERRQQLAQRLPSASNPLNQPMQNKMLGEMLEDLQEGNLDEALKQLKELQQQLKMGELDEQAQARLAEEMGKLAEAVGMNSPLAKSLQQASEAMKGDSTNGQPMSMDALQMAEMEMADMQDLMQQMKNMDEMLQSLKESKFAISGQCKKCGAPTNKFGQCSGNCSGSGNQQNPFGKPGQGGWKAGDTDKPISKSGGMKGAGRGRGGQAPFQEHQTQSSPDQLPGEFHAGPIQGMMPIDGEAGPGESIIQMGNSSLEYSQAAEEALVKEQVPLPYRQRVRAYFDTLANE